MKKEFSGQLHKFLASLTEATNQSVGKTVLYLPDLTAAGDAAEEAEGGQRTRKKMDKDFIQLLESTVIHWTRQIKEVVNNQDSATGQNTGASGPLEEIWFWRARTEDLSGISQQLDSDSVLRIVEILKAGIQQIRALMSGMGSQGLQTGHFGQTVIVFSLTHTQI